MNRNVCLEPPGGAGRRRGEETFPAILEDPQLDHFPRSFTLWERADPDCGCQQISCSPGLRKKHSWNQQSKRRGYPCARPPLPCHPDNPRQSPRWTTQPNTDHSPQTDSSPQTTLKPGAVSGVTAPGSLEASLRLWSRPHCPPFSLLPPPESSGQARAEQVRALVCGCRGRGGSGAGRSPAPSPGHSRAPALGDMSVVTGGGEAAGGAGGGGARVFFQSPRGGTGGSPGSSSGSGSSREDSAPVATVAAAGQVQQQQRRHQQGKVTVKYDRKELRKRLVLEEWIVEQLGQLYGCEVLGHWPGGLGSISPLRALL